MNQKKPRACRQCGEMLPEQANFCPECGMDDRNPPQSTEQERSEPDEVHLAGGNQLHLSDDSFTLPELLKLVQEGILWFERQLKDAEDVGRSHAANAIHELSQIYETLSKKIALGQETARITSRLSTKRHYPVGCPVCGKGNRAEARFCASCGTLLPETAHTRTIRYALLFAGLSDIGKVRENNEDTWYTEVLPLANGASATLLLVADGMGGAQAGEQASMMARSVMVQQITQAVQTRLPDTDEAWQAMLRQAAEEANQQIYTQARNQITQRGMGTTLTVLLVIDTVAHLVHVGDSRCYLFNSKGVADDGGRWLQLSTDHTLVARLIDIGHITAEEARKLPQRNMLYRALGVEATVECDTSTHHLNQDDVVLLCSDGLTAHLESPEIADIVLAAPSPESACRQLVNLANTRGGKDNISVVVAKVVATVESNRGSPK